MTFPLFYQRGVADCGAASLMMVAKYHGIEMSYEDICYACHLTSVGMSIYNLNVGAKRLGFNTAVLRCSIRDIIDEIPMPTILYWKQKHFSVLYNIDHESFQIADSINGYVSYSESDFASKWYIENKPYGILLALEHKSYKL